MCHAGEDGDVQGPDQPPISAVFKAVADGVPRGRREWVRARQSGERSLEAHPAVMGPGGEADGSCHGPDAALLEWRRGLAGVDEFAHPCAVGGDLFVERDHAPGQSNSPARANAVPRSSSRDRQWATVASCVREGGRRALMPRCKTRRRAISALSAAVRSAVQWSCGPCALGQARATQLAGVQRKHGRCDAVRVQLVLLAHASVAPRVHPRRLDHLVARPSYGGGQARTVVRAALDDPQ